MKIGLRGGHSPNCKGAFGYLDEQYEVRKIYNAMVPLLQKSGHEVVNCNSDAGNQFTDLNVGTNAANANECDIFISIHMNASSGAGHGTECFLYDNTNATMNNIATQICKNFEQKGYQNRGVKYNTGYHDLNATVMPAMIVETLFCDNKHDVDLYQSIGVNGIAQMIVDAINGKSTSNNTPVQKPSNSISSCKIVLKDRTHYGDDSRWYLEPCGDDYFRLRNKKTGLYLDVTNGSPNNGTFIQAHKGNGSDAQIFKRVRKSHDEADYILWEPKIAPGKYLSVEGNGINGSEKTHLKLWEDEKNSKQKFWMKQATDGTYLIMHTYSIMYISVK